MEISSVENKTKNNFVTTANTRIKKYCLFLKENFAQNRQ